MAERRMFAKFIIDSDAFIDMPTSSRLLYFDLSMRADDDGFVNNPKKIMKMTGASQDDLKMLIVKSFIIPFESGVVVIKHWKIHNYIQKDRYKETMYTEEKSLLYEKENKEYCMYPECIQNVSKMDTECIQNVSKMDTQVRLGKDRLGKDRLGETTEQESGNKNIPLSTLVDAYHATCISFPKVRTLTEKRKKALNARMRTGYTLEDFKKLFEMAENSDFLKGKNKRNWSADFDWLINDANMAKVLEGKYENKERSVEGDSDQGYVPSGKFAKYTGMVL